MPEYMGWRLACSSAGNMRAVAGRGHLKLCHLPFDLKPRRNDGRYCFSSSEIFFFFYGYILIFFLETK